jgi:transposase
MDLGNKKHVFCVLGLLTPGGGDEPVETGSIRNTRDELEAFADRFKGAVVMIEASTQSAWIRALFVFHGMRVVVANPRELHLITRSKRKSDPADAEALARLARADLKLIKQVHHLDGQGYADLAVIRTRAALVKARADLVNTVRSLCKGQGVQLKKCSTSAFASIAAAKLPRVLAPAIDPLLSQIESVSGAIRELDRHIETLADEHYPQTRKLRQIAGVGPLTALAFVLRLEDPARFRRSRDVGAFLGLVPKRSQSGDSDKQMHISKAGDPYVRKLLVQAAHYILGPFGSDTALRRHGLKIAASGGKAGKKRATIAVARKLAVVMHRLWADDADYDPLYTPKPTPKAKIA